MSHHHTYDDKYGICVDCGDKKIMPKTMKCPKCIQKLVCDECGDLFGSEPQLPPSVSEWIAQGKKYGFMGYYEKIALDKMMKEIRPKDWIKIKALERDVRCEGWNDALAELDKNFKNYLEKL